MHDTAVIWNLDPRHRPELEVEIEIIAHPDELPGFHYARAVPELEVDLIFVDDDILDAWFLDDDAFASVYELSA